MATTRIFKFDDVPVRHTANGAILRALIDRETCGSRLKTGTVTFPAGHAVEIHRHNCNEMIVVLSGRCAVELEGVRTELKPFDTVSVAAGQWHRFLNTGDEPFTILAVYDAEIVERTFQATGKTVRD
jgi:quercetin dioxygenase-like cupin family protein